METKEILELIIKEIQEKSSSLNELSCESKVDSFLYESIGLNKAIVIVKNYLPK